VTLKNTTILSVKARLFFDLEKGFCVTNLTIVEKWEIGAYKKDHSR